MIEVNISKGTETISKKIADCWKDLLPSQFAAIARIIYTVEEPLTAATQALAVLLNLPKGKFRALDAEVVYAQMLDFAAFIHTTNCDITNNLFPKIEAGGKVYYGPSDGAENLKAAEFHFCEMAVQDFYAGYQTEPASALPYLWKLLAILYRPAKEGYDFELNPDGDCRIPYNPNSEPYHIDWLQQHVDVSVAYATLLWYRACRAEWEKAYPAVFPQHSNGDEAPPVIPGYFMLMRNIAERGTYGNFAAVEQMPALNMFTEFTCILEENERIKQQQQEANNHEQ